VGSGVRSFQDCRRLKAGLQIPVVGQKKDGLSTAPLVSGHRIVRVNQGSRGKILIDGKPGSHNLTLWAYCNESPSGKPNCMFKGSYLVLMKNVKKGEELTVYYGPDYPRKYEVIHPRSGSPGSLESKGFVAHPASARHWRDVQ
jgi:hypothetical protein